ncbi:MAG: hypothetical protein RLZZ574_499 [Cyanobacteriota bacterium]|jgi:hypothetical protein
MDKIFFYCYPMGSPEEPYYQDLAICLGEGLKQLGIPFYADRNYWQLSPKSSDCLFQHDPRFGPDDCKVVIMNHQWFRGGGTIPARLFHSERKYVTVYLDGTDDVNQTYSFEREFNQFDLILKTHYSSKSQYPRNFYPWAFGLSQRLLNELDCISPWVERQQNLLVNFRDNGSHSVRNILPKLFFPEIDKVLSVNKAGEAYEKFPSEPYHRLMWEQTGRRHYPNYYHRLQQTAACAAFGGYFLATYPRNPASFGSRLLRKLIDELGWHSDRVLQWDSWRFWESLAAGCLTFQLDFAKYGLVLPVMPTNWQHYIGVDLKDVSAAVDQLKGEPELLAKIASQGREWAIANYAPEAVAQRFLQIVASQQSRQTDAINSSGDSTLVKAAAI